MEAVGMDYMEAVGMEAMDYMEVEEVIGVVAVEAVESVEAVEVGVGAVHITCGILRQKSSLSTMTMMITHKG